MQLTCVECKNQIDLSGMTDIGPDTVLECPTCGITLLVTSVSDEGIVDVEIMDEGK